MFVPLLRTQGVADVLNIMNNTRSFGHSSHLALKPGQNEKVSRQDTAEPGQGSPSGVDLSSREETSYKPYQSSISGFKNSWGNASQRWRVASSNGGCAGQGKLTADSLIVSDSCVIRLMTLCTSWASWWRTCGCSCRLVVFVVALLWNLTYAGVARWRWQQGLLGPCPNPRTYIYIYIYHQIFYAPYTNISLQLTKNMYNYMIFILYLCFYLFISRTIMHICINIWNYIQLCTEISYVSTLCLYIFWAFVRTPMSSSKIVNTYFVFSDRQSPMSSQKSISTYTWW